MLAESLAIISSAFFALSVVAIRKDLDKSNATSIAGIITAIGAILIIVPGIVIMFAENVDMRGVLIFFLSGLIHPGLARILYFKGMSVLGACTNEVLINIYPAITFLLGVVFFLEQPTIFSWLGLFLMILGVVLITKSANNSGDNCATANFKSSRRNLAYPLLTAFLFGSVYIIRKVGITFCAEPVAGVASMYSAALALNLALFVFSKNFRSTFEINRRTFRLYWKAGVASCIAYLCSLYALKYGDVFTVTSLRLAEPLFLFSFSYLLIKSLERITRLLVFGTVVLLFGIVMVVLF